VANIRIVEPLWIGEGALETGETLS
jgi:hypothetical protein